MSRHGKVDSSHPQIIIALIEEDARKLVALRGETMILLRFGCSMHLRLVRRRDGIVVLLAEKQVWMRLLQQFSGLRQRDMDVRDLSAIVWPDMRDLKWCSFPRRRCQHCRYPIQRRTSQLAKLTPSQGVVKRQ